MDTRADGHTRCTLVGHVFIEMGGSLRRQKPVESWCFNRRVEADNLLLHK